MNANKPTAQPIDISQVTSQALKAKTYLISFPEYYALSSATENSQGHAHQNVLDHVIAVFAGLENVLQFKDLPSTLTDRIRKHLSSQVGNKSRQENLQVATLLHDIAKADTLVTSPDGMATCPGHELIGAGRVGLFVERFQLNTMDAAFVERIVRYHGLTFVVMGLMISNGHKEKYLSIFQETVGDIAIELMLLMQADLMGGDLEKNNPRAFGANMNFLAWSLETLLEKQR